MKCPECGGEMDNVGMFEDLWQCPRCGAEKKETP